MDDARTPHVAGDEWLQEPSGFYGIKFGSSKEEAEKFVTFEQFGISGDWWGLSDNLPYPTQGVTHFQFGEADVTACLIFHPTDGLHCIHGSFAADQFGGLKSAFLALYGEPRDASSAFRQFSEVDWDSLRQGTYPPLQRSCEATVESMSWYSDKVFISLVSHERYAKGSFLIATWSYMRSRGGANKMRVLAERKLAHTRDEYSPPGGWTQEPDDFVGLKLGMTKVEAERYITFGKCNVTTQEIPGFPTREHFLYETTLNVAGLAIPGEVLFIEDRLINLGGKFDRSQWDTVRSAFIDLYGRPHVDEREEYFEQGLSRRSEWQGDRVRVGVLDFPDGTNFARFYYSQTLKGAKLKLTATFTKSNTPPPEPPKIVVEHTPSMLVLRLPDGTTLDYPRTDPPQVTLTASWHRGEDGRFVYDLDLDASMLARIGIGAGGRCVDRDAVASQPEGWQWMWSGWEAFIGEGGVSASGQTARFSITSAMLPGPMPTYLVRKDAKQALPGQWGRHAGFSVTHPPWPIPLTLPRRLYDAVLETLQQQAADSIYNPLQRSSNQGRRESRIPQKFRVPSTKFLLRMVEPCSNSHE